MPRTPAGETREKVFRFVRDRLLGGRPPTVREVQEAMGFRSVQSAREHLESLVESGRLAKDSGKARGYRLPGRDERPTIQIPLLGRVPAGPLDTAVEDLEGYLTVQSRQSPGELFGLRVQGESMIGAGILPGDVVVVRRDTPVVSGDIVVALVGEDATVKRLRMQRNRAVLYPENPDYEPILPNPDELKILGKVIEVRRYLEPGLGH